VKVLYDGHRNGGEEDESDQYMACEGVDPETGHPGVNFGLDGAGFRNKEIRFGCDGEVLCIDFVDSVELTCDIAQG